MTNQQDEQAKIAEFEKQLHPELVGAIPTEIQQVIETIIGGDVVKAREQLDEIVAELSKDVPPYEGEIEKHEIAGLDDDPQVPVHVYRHPQCEMPEATLVWLHGGGYLIGSAEDFGPIILSPAMTVISVDYRLAPEHRAPAAARDGCAAIEWVVANAEKLGIDPNRIAIGGGSAGGGAAAATALLNRDRNGPDLRLQLLIYPMLDERHDSHAAKQYYPPWLWNPAVSQVAWKLYDDPEGKSPYAAPRRATDLTRLPPAYVMSGALDMFRDECISYAQRLLEAQVPTELVIHPGCPHGFDFFAGHTSVGGRAIGHYADALKRACE